MNIELKDNRMSLSNFGNKAKRQKACIISNKQSLFKKYLKCELKLDFEEIENINFESISKKKNIYFLCVSNIKEEFFEKIILAVRKDANISIFVDFNKMYKFDYLKTRFPEYFI